MPMVNVNLLVDDKTYSGVISGVLELCGMAKNIKNGRIVKHIPTVYDSAKNSVVKAVDIIRSNKNVFLIAGGAIIIGGVVIGTITHFTNKEQRKTKTNFAIALEEYLNSAKEGALTLEILDNFIKSLDNLSSISQCKPIDLKIQATQFNHLINSIFDYTLRLAQANNIQADTINHPKIFKNKSHEDLKYYLNIQREVFTEVA